jgi:hypothetical protein
MLSEEKLRSLPEPAQTWWRQSYAYMAKNNTYWVSVKPGMEEYEEWLKLFRWMDWKPFGIKMIERRACETILVPAQWPEWFNAEYATSRPEGTADKRFWDR